MDIEVRHAERKELEEVNRLREMENELHVNGRPGWFRTGFGDELKNFIYGFYDDDNNDVIVSSRRILMQTCRWFLLCWMMRS